MNLKDLLNQNKQTPPAEQPKANPLAGLAGLIKKPVVAEAQQIVKQEPALPPKEEAKLDSIPLDAPKPVSDAMLDDIDFGVESKQAEIVIPQREVNAETFNNRAMIDGLPVEDQKSLLDDIRIIYEAFDQPELVGNATRNILLKLKENELLAPLLLPSDIGLMVRYLRVNHGIVASSKTVNKTKRTQKASDLADIESLVGDIQI